jgi:hypothetical protein
MLLFARAARFCRAHDNDVHVTASDIKRTDSQIRHLGFRCGPQHCVCLTTQFLTTYPAHLVIADMMLTGEAETIYPRISD